MNRNKTIIFTVVYMLMSFFVFTVFMAVPIFNVGVGILGCYYLIKQKANNETLKYYRIFSFVVLLLAFIGSATFALIDEYTPANLEGMFNLSFNITTLHIWLIILIGGSVFLYINDFLIRKICNKRSSKIC